MLISDWSSDVCSSDLHVNLWTDSPALPSPAVLKLPHLITRRTFPSGVRARSVGLGARGVAEQRQPRLVIGARRSEETTSELQSLMRISYAVFGLKTKKQQQQKQN